MLDLAIRHADALRDEWQRTALDPALRWYHGSYHTLTVEPADNTWEKLEMVSVTPDSGRVAGYLSAGFDHPTESVDSMGFVRFPTTEPGDASRVMFAQDALAFLDLLFERFGIRSIRWWSATANPANELYRRLVERHGARHVGTWDSAAASADRVVSDVDLYQLERRAWTREPVRAEAVGTLGSPQHDGEGCKT